MRALSVDRSQVVSDRTETGMSTVPGRSDPQAAPRDDVYSVVRGLEVEEFEGRVHLQGIVDWQFRPSVTTIRFEELEGRVHLQGIVI